MDAEDLRFFHKTFSENSKISENFIFLHKNGLKDFEKMMVFRRSHVSADPINKIDPTGLYECPLADAKAKKAQDYREDIAKLQDAITNWDGEDSIDELKSVIEEQRIKLKQAEDDQRERNDECQIAGCLGL